MSASKAQNTSCGTTAFSPRLLEVVTAPPLPLPRVVLYILLLLVFLLVMWSVLGQLDIVARAEGRLVPQSRIKIAQPFEGGRISKILVHDGDLVKAGQAIMLMDTQLSEADTEKLRYELVITKIMLRSVNAELEGSLFKQSSSEKDELFHTVYRQYEARRESYKFSIVQQRALLNKSKQDLAAAREVYKKLEETLPIHKTNEEAVVKLGKKGYVTKLAILEKQRIRIGAEQDFRAQKYVIQALQERIKEIKGGLNELKSQHKNKLLDDKLALRQRLGQLSQDWKQQDYRNRLMKIKAPQDGFVKDIAIHTEGSVVPAGTVLMNIVPVNEPLLAEVYIDNQDIGFISAGQDTRIKLMSYQFQKYGMIDGVVKYVSAGASTKDSVDTKLASGYKTMITLDKQYLERDNRKFLLRPGMQVTAEIKLGTRTVLEYILSPIKKTLSEAGMER